MGKEINEMFRFTIKLNPMNNSYGEIDKFNYFYFKGFAVIF